MKIPPISPRATILALLLVVLTLVISENPAKRQDTL